ncbi:molybdate ABC transporter permease subunit, partial [Clostridium perfringens]|nr:molybdate ABC transporter permease subunit [Clostridium perfringens]
MDISPIIISLKTATASMVLTFLLGLFVAIFIVKIKSEKIKMILDGILT